MEFSAGGDGYRLTILTQRESIPLSYFYGSGSDRYTAARVKRSFTILKRDLSQDESGDGLGGIHSGNGERRTNH